MNVALLLVIAAAMFATIVLAYQTVEAERAQRRQVERTVEVLEELRQINSAALSGETGQRGYLITLDRRYLAPYQMAREQLEPSLDRVRVLLGDDATARQVELIDQIDALARAKFDEMAESVELLENGRLLDARRATLTDEGVEAMERLVRAIAEMEDIESRILAERAAEAARSEARVLPLLGALFVLLIIAMLAGARLVGRAARAEAEASQAAAVSEARDRADLLARELNHRVKNLFAVILAIVQMSARDKPEAKEVTDSIAQRIRALLTAHEVSQGELERPVASLRALVETSLAPYRSSKHPAEIEGPDVMLPAKRVTPLGLVLHELTTNAVKYGAWKNRGTVHVSWTEDDGMLTLTWRESGADLEELPERKGFGSLLMTSAARQFGGTFERNFTKDGLQVSIVLPVTD
ncbi:MAG TPA: histidine kinase [Erythrobacter sp.]|uniref:histidine kinase n=2 Tax=Erythrobacteraceae TaxID=335929 RepID=A0ABS7JC07_9SPHN|nr:histidine kinase [Sphingomonadaceae bacterium]MBG75924.1 histidine kinase [Erythrobacteraceae bacterium]MBX7487559.1 CHASE3 domain-containing protein [Qipengyuania aerophila]MBY8334650.1 CHASE3 domain-containing protein [Qipengyuania pacifica]HCB78202.1 histidine kinase [Erythrobacter sp.]